jgi:hypothetical protein
MTLMRPQTAAMRSRSAFSTELAPGGGTEPTLLSVWTRVDLERVPERLRAVDGEDATADAYAGDSDVPYDDLRRTKPGPRCRRRVPDAVKPVLHLHGAPNAVAYRRRPAPRWIDRTARRPSPTHPPPTRWNGAYTALSNYSSARVDGLSRNIPNMVYAAIL